MDKLLLEEIYYLMVLGRTFELAAKEHYMTGEISGTQVSAERAELPDFRCLEQERYRNSIPAK